MTPSIPSIRSNVFLVALTLGLSACASMEERDAAVTGIEPERLEQVRAAAAAPPRLQAGDRFSYDSPDVTWEVVSVGADGRIAWRSNTGETQVTDANPLLPALEWASPERGSGKRLITNMSRPMFPLTPGEKLTFRETVDTNVPPFAWEYDWQCVTGPLERTDVPMGGFPTYRIQCGRKGTDEVVFHYAPEIGNYVKLVVQDAAGGMPQIRSLMAGNRDQLEGLRPIIRRVDLGTKGIFFRLHAGPVIDKVQADAICRTLSQRGVYCKVMTL